MDFRLSEEQEMLRDGARRFAADKMDYAARGKQVALDGDLWSELVDLGWLMLPIPESGGGLGRPIEDVAIIAEELGRSLAREPFIFSGYLPARLLVLTEASDAVLEEMAGGAHRYAVAVYETPHRFRLDKFDTIAVADEEGGYRLSGRKTLVLGGGEADKLIVAAQSKDGSGPSMFVVDASAEGITRESYRTIDELNAVDIAFEDVNLPSSALLADPEAAPAILEKALDEATVLLCADALGSMDRAIELTADYLKVRTQFGQPLANFQVLQHGVANLFIEANDARSMVYRSLSACAGDERERRRAVSACKVKVMEAARNVAGQSVHFHGGIGLTSEYPVGEHLRRALVSEQLLGNSQHHFERYMANSPSGLS